MTTNATVERQWFQPEPDRLEPAALRPIETQWVREDVVREAKAEEREACAREAERAEHVKGGKDGVKSDGVVVARRIAAAIRARK